MSMSKLIKLYIKIKSHDEHNYHDPLQAFLVERISHLQSLS